MEKVIMYYIINSNKLKGFKDFVSIKLKFDELIMTRKRA